MVNHSQPPASASILLVEDDELSRRVLRAILEARSYRVLPAACVSEARDLAAREASTIILVISDIGLPDGDGWELMEELVSEYNLRGIAVSAYGAKSDIERSHQVGFLRHLVKPIRLPDLENAMREAGVA